MSTLPRKTRLLRAGTWTVQSIPGASWPTTLSPAWASTQRAERSLTWPQGSRPERPSPSPARAITVPEMGLVTV